MRILMINSVCGIRSTGRICTDIATALEAEGHEVKIAYGRETVPEQFQKYAVRIGTDMDVKLHALKARLFDASGFGSKRATKKFIEWSKEYDPDVIHLHNIHGYYIHIGVLFDYLRTCGKKIIWTLHDCWAFTGHCAYFDYVGCDKWKTGCWNCPQKKEYPTSLLFSRSKRNFSSKKESFTGLSNVTLVTPSEWLASLVHDSFLWEYKTVVIHNGIDMSVFKPTSSNVKEKMRITDKKMILGVASIWERRKGLDDFICLAGMLSDEYRIVLVGLTQEQIKGLPQPILGIARTNSVQELAELYSAADVFLNLTYEDNYPTTNLEARACGTPVITYRTGGSPESAGDDAIVIERGNIENVLHAVKSIRKANIFELDCMGIATMEMKKLYLDLYSFERNY